MKRRFFLSALSAAGLAFCGCVDVPADGTQAEAAGGLRPSRVQGLDPGAKNTASLHFDVHAYDFETAGAVSEYSERLYTRIMTDTGLDSFRPRELYGVYIYGTREEFIRKTGLPEWSAGAADGSSIYTFAGPHLKWVLPHEITHLIFSEYMGPRAHEHKWLNEGLAVYEEQVAAPFESPSRFGNAPIPFQSMVALVPLSEENRKVSDWYHQVGSVVRFLIERSRGPGFHIFLSELKNGRNLDDAVRTAFPGLWSRFSDVERAWGSVR